MGFRVILESGVMQKGLPATAGSKMLEEFIAPVDATVVTRLNAAGACIVGRVDMSEFGVAGLFEEVLTDSVNGVFLDISTGKTDAILSNDYTGVISRKAASAGLCYIHPTYGTVSRYGLIPAVCSMDQIGIVCKNADVGFSILEIISGYDSKDGVMSNVTDKKEAEEPSPCFPCFEIDINPIATDYSNIYPQIMEILCSAEIGNNISRYDGIKFGYRAEDYKGLDELYTKSRTEAFGEDVKLAAIIGAMVLSQENYARYYDKAMRIRRLIKNSLEFDKYDVIVTKCPLLSRLCGLPALSTPEHVYIADAGREDILEAVSKAVRSGGIPIEDDSEFSGKLKAIKGGAL